MSEYTNKERQCEASFESDGPYWHAYTSGKETSILFTCDEDMRFAMNVTAQAAHISRAQVHIIAFQVMNNHFHFILSGSESGVKEFFSFIIRRLSRSFKSRDSSTVGSFRSIKLNLKQIDNLQSLRNSIVYVNRNGYVASPSHTPFSYPWGTSRYYFQTFPKIKQMSDINSPEARMIFHGRDPELPEDWEFIEGYVCPGSYCAIKFGMAMFRDAHHYFYCISKNVESYSGIACDIDDGDFLTDQELFGEVSKILNSTYSGKKLRDLSNAQKLDLARTLHFKYNSSNGQIRRTLGVSQYDINQLFGNDISNS